MAIRFPCVCGQELTAPDEYAGQRVRCTACGAAQAVPGTGAIPREGILSAAGDVEGGLAKPAGSGSGRWSRRRLLLVAAAVLLLGGTAAALWLLWPRSRVPSDFDLVPRDAHAFLTFRPADILKTPAGKQLYRELEDLRILLSLLEEQTGLRPEELERITAVLPDARRPEEFWVVFRTARPYDQARLREAYRGREQFHRGKTYYRILAGACYFHDRRTFVVGREEGVKQCLGLPRRPGPGPLDEPLERASRKEHHLAAAVRVTPEVRGLLHLLAARQLTPLSQPLSSLMELQTAFLTGVAGDHVELALSADFPTEEKARKASETLEGQVEQARLLLPVALLLPGLREREKIAAHLKKLLDQLTPRQDGATVALTVTVEGDAISLLADVFRSVQRQGVRLGRAAEDMGRVPVTDRILSVPVTPAGREVLKPGQDDSSVRLPGGPVAPARRPG